MPLLALITGPLGKIAIYAALALSLAGAAAAVIHQHDAKVRAELVAAEQAKQIATMTADHARTVAALEAQAADAAARAAHFTTIRRAIDAAPNSDACSGSAAVRAAVDGLRRKPAAGH